MDADILGRLEREAGARVVHHRGLWWRQVKPLYWWPVHLLKPLEVGSAWPPRYLSLVGYEYLVPDHSHGNASLPMMLLRDVSGYGLLALSSKDRSQVRRGVRLGGIRRLSDIGDLIERGLEINRSALARQGWGGDRSGYVDPARWARGVRVAHGLGIRETWGAYVDGQLAAYLRGYEVEGTMYITQQMSHTAFLPYSVNDALLHVFLTDCRDRGTVRQVAFGLECAKVSLNAWKRKFGFETVKVPVHRRVNPLVRALARWTRYAHYLGVA